MLKTPNNNEIFTQTEKDKIEKHNELEEIDKAEVISWVTDIVKKWHDEINPDYVFLTETGAVAHGYVLKEAWKNAFPNEAPPSFFRIDPYIDFVKWERDYQTEFDKYVKNRISGSNPKIIVFDESGSGTLHKYFSNGEVYDDPGGDSIGLVCSSVRHSLKRLNKNPLIYAHEGGGPRFNKLLSRGVGGEKMIDRAITSRAFGVKSARNVIFKDEKSITDEYLRELVDKDIFFLTGKMVKDKKQRKLAFAWINKLKEVGKEAGQKIKEEVEDN
jgi:hypothetical protein